MRTSRSRVGQRLGYLSIFRPESDTTQTAVMDVAVVPAADGDPVVVARGIPLTQSNYFGLSYSWHPTDDRLVYIEKKRMYLLDLRSGSPTAPKPLAPQLGEVAPTVLGFTRDGRSAVMGIDVFDDRAYGDPRPRAIALVPLDGSTPSKVSIDDSRWMFRQILKADERTVWQPDGASIHLLLTERATGEKAIVRFNPRNGESRVLWKALGRLANLTSGGNHDFIVAQYEDMQTPPNILRFTADFSKKERISHIDPRLDEVAVGTVDVFETTVPVHDGGLDTVRTAVLLPAGAKRGDELPANRHHASRRRGHACGRGVRRWERVHCPEPRLHESGLCRRPL